MLGKIVPIGGLLAAAGEGAFSQVVLARHKDSNKLAALKVVYLQSPEMDAEHLAVTRKCACACACKPSQ